MPVVPKAARAAIAMLTAVPATALAQTTVTGRVTRLDGLPVAGAVVEIVGRPGRVRSARNGDFAISVTPGAVAGSLATLRASAAGSSPALRLVLLRDGTHRIDLVLSPEATVDKISTGVAVPTPPALVPFTIGTVTADVLAEVPATTLLGGVRGRMAGVRVESLNGDPAGAPVVRLRGAEGFAGGSDPLIILDGAVVRGSLADVPALDIERIEVAKGPAAAAIYGSEGAAGVIQIFTLRGGSLPAGRIHLNLRTEVGISGVTQRFDENAAHDFEITTGPSGAVDFVRDQAGQRVHKADRVADNPYPQSFDHQRQLFMPDLLHQTFLSIGGRQRSTGFMVSMEETHSGSPIVLMRGFRRRSVRLNLDQRFGTLVDVSLGGFRGGSGSDMFTENSILSPLVGLRFLEPHFDLLARNPDGSPYLALFPDGGFFNPLYTLANLTQNSRKDRFIGGGIVSVHPARWIEASVSHHVDREQGDSLMVVPAGFAAFAGTSSEQLFDARSNTTEASAALTGRLGILTGVTRIGYLYEQRQLRDSTERLSLSTPGVGSETASRLNIDNRAIYGVAVITLRSRYVLDAAVRRERRSFESVEAEPQWFYRVAGLWRAGDDFRLGGLDDLRLHVAYGTAGTPPKLSLGPLIVVPAGTPPSSLPPARTGELEVGIDLRGWQGRFALEYAYSRKTTSHLPGRVPGPFSQLIDAGSVRSSSHELTARATIVQRPALGWDLTLTADRIRSRITNFTGANPLDGSGFPPFLLRAGGSLGTMYGSRFVRAVTELSDDPDKKSQSGPGQAYDPASFVVNEEGYVVAKAAWRCGEDLRYRDSGLPCSTPERPILYVSCLDAACSTVGSAVGIGDATPDFRAGMQSHVHFHRLRASVVLDWSQGGDVYNETRQQTFSAGRDPVFDQRGKPDIEKKSTKYYAVFFNNGTTLDYFVESGTYLKITELALTYSLGQNQLRALGLGGLKGVNLGLVGRNLLTLTGYSGTAPDLAGRVDFFQYPEFPTLTGKIEISF